MLDILLGYDPIMLLAFIGAGLVLNLTPGVDFVFVSASGIQGGPRIGMAAAVGINLGVAVHVIAAAAGLSALLLVYPGAYQLVRLVGVVYLLWLAWQAWTAADDLGTGRAALSLRSAIRRGFLTNVLNPKTALFIFAFIPQFTQPGNGPIWAQTLVLGAIFLINGFAFSLTLGALAGMMSDILRARVRAMNKITAILFGGLAARLIID
ncbi:MAG: LysE family translocator [Paracoccaceae bacterium]